MVVCKYYQHGNCRFGQYCKFEHVNFGSAGVNKMQEKSPLLAVAEDILNAERGGQWPLSCFGPFKEQPCIPEMEDLSQEEVRWEMYQAQKNGTVDQFQHQFQQLCQTMKAKRDALKNPTHETMAMLEKLSQPEQTKSNFTFATPQLGNATSSVFGQKTFGTTNNAFSGGFSANPAPSTSIFARPTNPPGTSVFGGKPTFGSSNVFASGTTTNTSVFGGAQTTPTFGGLATQQPTSIFGGAAAQSTFGQPPAFSAQAGSPFSKAQTPQNSVFGGSTVFGETTAATNVFGGAAPTNSVFGSNATDSSKTVFGQTQQAAFPAPSVFGGNTFAAASNPSVFGGQSNFGSATVPAGSVFAATNAATFGTMAQGNAFAAPPNAAPFGTAVTTTAAPFGTNNAPFGTTTNTGSFPTQPSIFSFAAAAKDATNTFATAAATSTQGSVFNTPSTTFGSSAFGTNVAFTSASATPTTTAANPFATKSVFGEAPPASSFGVFGNAPAGISLTVVIDESNYSMENDLTDDEKSAYMASHFTVGNVPVRPPTKALG